jgi:Mannosyltransferase (PIG-V)
VNVRPVAVAGASARSPRFGGISSSRPEESTLRDTWRWFALSRLLIWFVGCIAIATLGTATLNLRQYDPTGISTSFGSVGNVLAAPAVRWDAIWYLQIAEHGYRTAQDAGFLPLYPLLIRVGSVFTGSAVVAGVLISLAALFAGLEIVRRLTALELGSRVAATTVRLIAFGPLALFMSAVYTESLFIALSAGTFYAARRGRWWMAGVLGALAALSRIGGSLLLVPVVLLFFYGPRADAEPRVTGAWWKPRYHFSLEILWAALIPAASAAFSGYLALRGLGADATLHAQQTYWAHRIALPVTAVWQGALAAWHELGHEIAGTTVPFSQSDSILQCTALVVAVVLLIGVFRRLPLAYGAYVTCGLLQALAAPTVGDPLRGLDRYASMRFPLFMCAAAWAVDRGAERKVLVISVLLMAFFAIQFATWQWVGAAVF